jgi:hypothetical protein
MIESAWKGIANAIRLQDQSREPRDVEFFKFWPLPRRGEPEATVEFADDPLPLETRNGAIRVAQADPGRR